jgi:6,7-dimethyl-8-ribityllumazine synthase
MRKEHDMGKMFEGQLSGKGMRIGIVVSRFNDLITSNLLDGARDGLIRNGVLEKDIDVAWVPGSFEIPFAALKMQQSKKYKAIVCLGAVIRGATPHFDYLAAEVTKGMAQVGLDGPSPVINGVIMSDTVEQAVERAGAKVGNKGFTAAVNALEMADLNVRLSRK